MATTEVRKECAPKACKEDIVDVVLTGPQHCIQYKACGEGGAGSGPPLAPDAVPDLETLLTLAQELDIRRGTCHDGTGPLYSWSNEGAYPSGSWFMVQFSPRGSTESFDVDWGDGSEVVTGTTASETHQYTTPGTYTMTFTINSTGECNGMTFTREIVIT